LPPLQHAAAFYFIVFLGMKYIMPAFLVIGLLVTSCKNNPSQNKANAAIAKDSSDPRQAFFPVPEYIGGQLKMIDSLQLPLNITVTVNNKTTSRIATDMELRKWAQDFQQPDISDTALKNQYIETSIADQAVPSVTFIYSTANNMLPVQKINVFVKPDPSESDKVTGIYIEKMFVVHDTVFNQKLYWKTGKNLQVITEKKINGTVLPVEQVKITWDPSS
jgi:hypothetical protein